jgi:NAD(P)-dependent dehydrogenase (short-subunit alcohol dehydrogenase family)
MKINLDNQRILVTGASRGIGLAITSRLLEAGATVIAQFHQDKGGLEALRSRYGRCEILQADLSIAGECQWLFEAAITSADGQLHGLVNNAGIAIESRVDKELTGWCMDWDRTMHVNLRSAGMLSREFVNQAIEHGTGRIVHIASRAAFRGDTPEYLAYAASKGGMVALSRSIARGFGRQGVKSFVVAPGFVRTDMSQEFIQTYGEQHVTSDLALTSLTLPTDIAPTVVFLLSGLADHATGSTIDINAGSYVH